MIKKSSDKILSVMDPVCLHHDMSGLGVGRSGRVGGGVFRWNRWRNWGEGGRV